MDFHDFYGQIQSEQFIDKELAREGLSRHISLEAQIQKEVGRIKLYYKISFLLTLGLAPASFCWNMSVFDYMKQVTRCDIPNPYHLFCKIKEIHPYEFGTRVINASKEAMKIGEFNPWPIRVAIYSFLALFCYLLIYLFF